MYFSITIKGGETKEGTKISSKFWATQPLLEITCFDESTDNIFTSAILM